MESIASLIRAKIESARALIAVAPMAGADKAAIEPLRAQLGGVEAEYALAAGRWHRQRDGGERARAAAAAAFARVVAAAAFGARLDRLVGAAEDGLRAAGAPLREAPGRVGAPGGAPGGASACADAAPRRGRPRKLTPAVAEAQRLVDAYAWGGGAPPPRRLDFERCDACGIAMAVDPGRSELRCAACGVVRSLDGMVFEDSQFYSQEGQKSKSGAFNPNRHFIFWWSHLTATEPEDELGDSAAVLGAIGSIVRRDRLVLGCLTVNDFRAMLREIGRTDLNKNIPLLMKKVTGYGPPPVPEAVAIRVENLFSKAIEISERVRNPTRSNRSYYPFYIARIIESITAADSPVRGILYYVYMQSDETVLADDEDWALICAELPELTYSPTDRSLPRRYAPV